MDSGIEEYLLVRLCSWEEYHWSSWNSSSLTTLVSSLRLCSGCTGLRYMGKKVYTVHAVENPVFDPSHGNLSEIEIPSFLLLFSQIRVIYISISSGITIINHNIRRNIRRGGKVP